MSVNGKHRSPSSTVTPILHTWYFVKTNTHKTAYHFFAGLTTGCLSACLLQPADLLKTRLQQSHSTTLLPTLRSILAKPNAVRSLWRGTLPSVIRTGVGSALYFSTLNALRVRVAAASSGISSNGNTTASNILPSNSNISTPPTFSEPAVAVPTPLPHKSSSSSSSSSTLPTLTPHQNLLTGALARASAGFVMMPVTVLKVRYESSLYTYPSLLSASRGILATEGFRGFFAGYGATAARDAPYAGLYVAFYEGCKVRLGRVVGRFSSSSGRGRDYGTKADVGAGKEMLHPSQAMAVNFLSGAIAAVMATTATNPFDTVKTRLQLMPGKYGNMLRAGRMIVREEGVRRLFDGLGLRVGRKALSSALAWTGYEELVRRLEGRLVG